MEIQLIPQVKELTFGVGHLRKNEIYFAIGTLDHRLEKALQKLPWDETGTPVAITVTGKGGEGYRISILQIRN